MTGRKEAMNIGVNPLAVLCHRIFYVLQPLMPPPKTRKAKLDDDGMAVCSFLKSIHDKKVLGPLAEASSDSTKPTKIIEEQKNNF